MDESEEFAFHPQEDSKEDQENMKCTESATTPDTVNKGIKFEACQKTAECTSIDQDLQDMLHLAESAKLRPTKPYVSIDDQYRFYRVNLVPDSQLPGSSRKKINVTSNALKNQSMDGQPLHHTPFTPRTAIASRRLMNTFEFDRSAVKRRFHAEYPENAPDLRENSSQGKRHLIHGHHAYYFH